MQQRCLFKLLIKKFTFYAVSVAQFQQNGSAIPRAFAPLQPCSITEKAKTKVETILTITKEAMESDKRANPWFLTLFLSHH